MCPELAQHERDFRCVIVNLLETAQERKKILGDKCTRSKYFSQSPFCHMPYIMVLRLAICRQMTSGNLADFKGRFGSQRLALERLEQICQPEVYPQLCR
jgi:hypothetical protein